MPNYKSIADRFSELNTPQIVDACVRLSKPIRVIAPEFSPIQPDSKIAGRALPVQHFGSVDIFFEKLNEAKEGDILVIDNQNRRDEACIGDLTALEARSSGVIGFIINGLHRDTTDLRKLDFPVFSFGANSKGPTRRDERTEDAMQIAKFDGFDVNPRDFVFADDDGVIFVNEVDLEDVLAVAEEIRNQERKQVHEISQGKNMREQLKFNDYLDKRIKDPNYSFRDHLREIGGAIEE